MTHIKTRYGTSGAWSSENPVLLAGEKGVESNTGKIKIGDGSTAWNSLPYSSVPPASPVFTGTPTAPTPTSGDNSTKIATTQYVQGELGGLAPTASPAFTGVPTAPTPAPGDDDTSVATTAFVNDAIADAIADALDAAKLAAHPIGSLLITENSASPDTYLGGGTWTAYGEGRVLIGVDSGDVDFDTAGETGGAKTHDHDLDTATAAAQVRLNSDGDFAIRVQTKTGITSYNTTRKMVGSSEGTDPIATTIGTGLQGHTSDESNMPPYIAVYMWKRTA